MKCSPALEQKTDGRESARADLKEGAAQKPKPPPQGILSFHQKMGNQAFGRVIQAKLKVGSADDEYEREADRIADLTMRMPEPGIQRNPTEGKSDPACGDEDLEEDFEEVILRKPTQRNIPSSLLPQEFISDLQGMRREGQPLPSTVRSYFEPRFGYDFNQVRVHTNSNAVRFNSELNTKAFTHGRHIYFGAGRYSPNTLSGRWLLSHELTHVVQQVGVGPSASLHTAVIQRRPEESEVEPQGVSEYRVYDPIGRMATIYFTTASSTLDPDDKSIIERVKRDVKLRLVKEKIQVRIFGFADYRGSEKYNLGLTNRRAAAVAAEFADIGKNPNFSYGVKGLGETEKFQKGKTSAELSRYRRADIYVLPPAAPKFPKKGIKVIGVGARDLVRILSDCTGLLLGLDADNMLIEMAGPVLPGKTSLAAQAALLSMLRSASVGVIIDTDPASEGAVVGVYDPAHPGYQRIDVSNLKKMEAASGEKKGLTACDTIMHEVFEASTGRKAVLGGKQREMTYKAAHAAGKKLEDKIRADLGLPPRSSEPGNMVMLGNLDKNTLLMLDSILFRKGKEIYTQLNLIKFAIGPLKIKLDLSLSQSGDPEVIESHVVKGEVTFKTRAEAIKVFNKYASDFGYKPIR